MTLTEKYSAPQNPTARNLSKKRKANFLVRNTKGLILGLAVVAGTLGFEHIIIPAVAPPAKRIGSQTVNKVRDVGKFCFEILGEAQREGDRLQSPAPGERAPLHPKKTLPPQYSH